MPVLDEELQELKRAYEVKYKHRNFLHRQLSPDAIRKLTKDFNTLWETEDEKIFPRVNDFPGGARRLLHPKESDHLAWLEVAKINDHMLSIPKVEMEKALLELLQNDSASKRLTKIWADLSDFARYENSFIDRHLPTLTRLVSQCPGAWLERSTFVAFSLLASEITHFFEKLSKDILLFKDFIKNFEQIRKYPLSVKIIGIGEITTTIELLGGPYRGVIHREGKKKIHYAVKKMPTFPSVEEAQKYMEIFHEYNKIIRDEIGIKVPLWGVWSKPLPDGKAVVYNWQERLPQHSIASTVIKKLDNDSSRKLIRLLIQKTASVFKYNLSAPTTLIGFDAQLPNWSIVGIKPRHYHISGDEELIYLDTSTPLMRRKITDKSLPQNVEGINEKFLKCYDGDLLNTEIFLKSVPFFLRPIVRATALREVVNRYYLPRKVITDIIASLYLYERPDLIPQTVEDINKFIESELAEFHIKPFSVEEIESYHKTDTIIWVFFRAVKRFDRWLKEDILGKKYEQRLPKKKFVPGPFGEF